MSLSPHYRASLPRLSLPSPRSLTLACYCPTTLSRTLPCLSPTALPSIHSSSSFHEVPTTGIISLPLHSPFPSKYRSLPPSYNSSMSSCNDSSKTLSLSFCYASVPPPCSTTLSRPPPSHSHGPVPPPSHEPVTHPQLLSVMAFSLPHPHAFLPRLPKVK